MKKSPKTNAAERQKEILELLAKNGAMKTLDLANYFHVSRETMRRDLIELQELGLVDKWFGGVISTQNLTQHSTIYEDVRKWFGSEQPSPDRKSKPSSSSSQNNTDGSLPSLQLKIAEKALALLPPHATVFLDGGDIALQLAELLNRLSGFTIITASIPVASICMSSSNKVLVCGGVIAPQIHSLTGISTIDFLKQLKTHAAVFESAGFQNTGGPTGNDLDYSQVQKAALNGTQTSIVLADSSRAEYSSLTRFARWDEIDYLITDSRLDPAFRNKYASETNIILADV